MPIFAVLSENAHDGLGKRIAAQYSGNYLEAAANQWLIAADATTQDVCLALGVCSGNQRATNFREFVYGRVMVLKIDAYFGAHNALTWEWLDHKSRARHRT